VSNIAELYSRDPFENSDKDIDAIIADLREKMRNFKVVGVPAKSTARTPPKADPTLQVDFDL